MCYERRQFLLITYLHDNLSSVNKDLKWELVASTTTYIWKFCNIEMKDDKNII